MNLSRLRSVSFLVLTNLLATAPVFAKTFTVGMVSTTGASYPAENIYVDLDDQTNQFKGIRVSENMNHLFEMAGMVKSKTTIKKLFGSVPVVRAQFANDFSAVNGGRMQIFIRGDYFGTQWMEQDVELHPCSTCALTQPWAVFQKEQVVSQIVIAFDNKALPQSVLIK